MKVTDIPNNDPELVFHKRAALRRAIANALSGVLRDDIPQVTRVRIWEDMYAALSQVRLRTIARADEVSF